MRLIARVAGVAVIVAAAAAVTAQPAAAANDLNLMVSGPQHRAPIVGGEPGHPGRTTGYWGEFGGDRAGSYRATCSWLADGSWAGNAAKRDNRLMCTVILTFRNVADPAGASVVAQGLMLRPHKKEGLFTRASARTLSITGATGEYRGEQGLIYPQDVGKIRVDFGVT